MVVTKLAPRSPFHQLPSNLYHGSQEYIENKKIHVSPTMTGLYFRIILCWLHLYKTCCRRP